MKSKIYPKWPCMVQINISNIFWYLLVVLTNVSSVRSYARSFVCKNTLQKRKDVLKIVKGNLSFFVYFWCCIWTTRSWWCWKVDCMFLPTKHISRQVIEKLQSIGIYVFLWGDWLVQNCKGAKLYHEVIQQLRGTNFTQSRPPIPLGVDNCGRFTY